MKLQIIIEKADHGELFGRIEGKGDFMPVTVAKSAEGVIKNIREMVKDYKKHEGKQDLFWKKVSVDTVTWEVRYDVQAFFMQHPYLSITAVAGIAGINPGLLRQYSSGVKHPSAKQVVKIEKAIKQIVKQLNTVTLYAA